MLVPVPQFTAPSYGQRTPNEVQRCVNLYPEKTSDGYVLVSTPGLYNGGVTPSGSACRGAIAAGNGVVISVRGNTVYTIFGSTGTLTGSTGPVYMVDNGITVLIIEATTGAGYNLNLISGIVTPIADVNFPVASHCTFQDGYFIVSKQGTDRFYLSALLDGTTWTPVIFATAESKADPLSGVWSNGQYLYLVGKQTTEPWYNTGAASNPFERVNGAVMPIGALSARTMANMNGSLYFMAATGAASGAIWRITGTGYERISTPYIESIVRNFDDSSCFAFCYQIEGHGFYQLTSTSPAYSFVYDITEGSWHQKESNVSGSYTYDRLRDVMPYDAPAQASYGFDNLSDTPWIVGDNRTSVANNREGTVAIRRERMFGPIESETKRVFHRQIKFTLDVALDFLATASLTATLDWTDDEGLTYSTAVTLTKTLTSGQTGQRVTLTANRLGSSVKRFYRLRLVGPSGKLILRKCELDLAEGRF